MIARKETESQQPVKAVAPRPIDKDRQSGYHNSAEFCKNSSIFNKSLS
jgi:hypothetical protein